MRAVQRACAAGAALWLASHAPLPALLSLDVHRLPALTLLAVAAVLAATALLLRPLLGGSTRLGAGAAWAAAAVVPLSGLAVMPWLPVTAWRTYANWWPGATQVLVVALVVRRRWPAALAAELASALVVAVQVLRSGVEEPAAWIAALEQPALLWFSAAVAVRALFDRTAREVARYEAVAARAAAEEAAAGARAGSARQRRAELDLGALPLLRQVAAAGTTDERAWAQLPRAAVGLERRLRDDLRARALLDAPVRARLRAARARGCTVDVVDDRAVRGGDEEFLAGVRGVLTVVLPSCADGTVTLRLPPGGSPATLAVEAAPATAAAVAWALQARLPAHLALDVDVDAVGGSLWAELRAR
ncbi:hypothetical protein MN205_07775 [Kineococcus sp. TRM81007]|uniref:hypothetical protein n=1 Tax=Kineococcus sp. TRM81007 TaxID=2925831 RepID=UPI001F55B7E5|nr:hypothetical protein [Kineococcus sp. TRM81007]MCI2238393.1 hypothetical protein [Kineococcus sp. TRM81007]